MLTISFAGNALTLLFILLGIAIGVIGKILFDTFIAEEDDEEEEEEPAAPDPGPDTGLNPLLEDLLADLRDDFARIALDRLLEERSVEATETSDKDLALRAYNIAEEMILARDADIVEDEIEEESNTKDDGETSL